MPLLNDAKRFVREMVGALEGSLERIARKNPGEQLFLASQLIGSCDSLTALLLFFGESVPGMRRFAEGGRERLAAIRRTARKLRSDAYREVCDPEEAPEPAQEPSEAADDVAEEPVGGDATGDVTPIGEASGS